MPTSYSFFGTVLLLFLNIFSILLIVDFFIPFLVLWGKKFVIVLMGLLMVFNYLALYKGKYYKDVFADFDNAIDRYRKWNKYVSMYIVSSILLMLVILAIANYRHNGHL